MFAYIGRQAIYNRDFVVAGYELLYRNGTRGNSAFFLDGDAATRSLLSDAVNVFGFQELTDGLPAYINFTRNLLMEDFALLADPKSIVVEVPGDSYVDGALVSRLNDLKSRGYRLSLDGYYQVNGVYRFDRYLRFFDVIRINLGAFPDRKKAEAVVDRLKQSRARLLAERVEDEAGFDLALQLNFALFQGYYFEKPKCLSKQVPFAGSAYGRMLDELLRYDVSFQRCGDIIASDPLLTHTFLHQVSDSVETGLDPETEIRQGVIRVGVGGLRRYLGQVLLKQGNITGSDELPRKAYLRGRFIEELMDRSATRIDAGIGFFLGVFSLLEQTIGVTRTDLTASLENLDPAMSAALMGSADNEYARFLQYAVIYEMANEKLILPDIRLKISAREASALFMQCSAEADEVFGVPSPPLELY